MHRKNLQNCLILFLIICNIIAIALFLNKNKIQKYQRWSIISQQSTKKWKDKGSLLSISNSLTKKDSEWLVKLTDHSVFWKGISSRDFYKLLLITDKLINSEREISDESLLLAVDCFISVKLNDDEKKLVGFRIEKIISKTKNQQELASMVYLSKKMKYRLNDIHISKLENTKDPDILRALKIYKGEKG
jgi:hypothetical protein